TASFVKLRMAKLSIHAIGQGCGFPSALMLSIFSLRANIQALVYLSDFGPAARTSSGTSNLAKFSSNLAASCCAWTSYARLSAHALRGFSISLGTSGQDVGIERPNASSVTYSDLASLPSRTACTMERVCFRLMRLPM